MTANAGRPDLDLLVKAGHVPAGEPVFLLRGRDPAAVAGVLAWAAKARKLGVPLAVVEQGLQQADALAAWAPKRAPDAGHLSEAEALQLGYQFDRRAWRAREDARDAVKILLAEQRGFRAGLAAAKQTSGKDAA